MKRVIFISIAMMFLLSCRNNQSSNDIHQESALDVLKTDSVFNMPLDYKRIIKYDSNGQIASIGYVRKNVKSGVWKTYKNGSLKSIESYIKDSLQIME